MRLYQLKLTNYIGIYNGMGLKEINIDFSKCAHKILVMKGDNGSGKSTIYRALSPMNDSTNEFISGNDGKKLISYLLDDGSILEIRYISQAYFNKTENVWRYRPAKCSILRKFINQSPVELNPSGNVSTAKDILYDLFKLDDNFLILSALSATNKGIGMQKPAERKRYVNVIIDSLGEFININKFLSKKGTILKSMMNSLTTKLSQIDNIELVTEQWKNDTKTLQEMELEKNKLIESTSSIKSKIQELNKKGDITELYQQESKRYCDIKKQFSEIDPNIVFSEEELQKKTILQSKISTELEIYKNQVQEKIKDEEELRNDITKIEAILTTYPDIHLKKDTEEKYQKILQQIEFYQTEFHKIGFYGYQDISELEYEQVLRVIESIESMICRIHQTYDRNMISNGIVYIKKHTFIKEDYIKLLQSLQHKEELLEKEFQNQEFLKERARDFDKIPKDCNHIDSCSFISSIISAKKQIWDIYQENQMKSKKEELLQMIEEIKEKEIIQQQMLECMKEIDSITTYISANTILIDKFFGRKYYKSIQDIYDAIENSLFIDINLKKYMEYTNYIKIFEGLQEDKKSLEESLLKYKDFDKNQSIHMSQYERLQEKLEKLLEKKKSLLDKIRTLSDQEETLTQEIQKLTIIKSSLQLYHQLLTEIDQSTKLIGELKEKVQESLHLSENLKIQSQKLNQLVMNDIPLLSSRVEKAKYQIVLFEQYKKDYDEYSHMNEKLQKVLFYSSTKGIQSIYIEAFMNSMLQLTNQLLQLLFQGRFMIKQFIVGESEFSIPCIDTNGQERDDIVEMSDSQLSMISMIISFVILHKASEYYNIIKLDEVDANLDNTNRLQFAVLIHQIIDILHFHQCIIISHNNEIDLSQVDMVIFKIDKKEELRYLLSSGANIIYNYNR